MRGKRNLDDEGLEDISQKQGKGVWGECGRGDRQLDLWGSFEANRAIMGCCRHNRENGSRSAPRRKKKEGPTLRLEAFVCK